MAFIAINDEQIKTAVMNGNRPPLHVIAEPAGWLSTVVRWVFGTTLNADNLPSYLTSWIARCWDRLPDRRPSFKGEQSRVINVTVLCNL